MATEAGLAKIQPILLKPSTSKYRAPSFCLARQPNQIPYPTTSFQSLGCASPIFKIASGSCDYYSLRIPLVKAGFRRIPHPLYQFPCNIIWGKSQPRSGLLSPVASARSNNTSSSLLTAPAAPGELQSSIPLLDHPTQLISSKQKFNHFPGSHANLGCKRGMYLTIDKLKSSCDADPSLKHAAVNLNFVPQTFLYPDQKEVLTAFLSSAESSGKRYIWKPARGSCGRGIVISGGGPANEREWKKIIQMIDDQALLPVDDATAVAAAAGGGDAVNSTGNSTTPPDLPVSLRKLFRQYVVQEYLENPMLINGRKVDFRLYVGVTSFDPLVVYLHRDGLVRFAAHAYEESSRFGQLTNYSIGRRLETKAEVDEEGTEIRPAQLLDLKWNLSQFQQFVNNNPVTDDGASFEQLMNRAKEIIVKTLIAAKPRLTKIMERIGAFQENYFELFGFDVMFDRTGKAWLIEVNTLPSLESSSTMDYHAKSNVVTDLLNMTLMEPFERDPLCFAESQLTPPDVPPPGDTIPFVAPYVPLNELRHNPKLQFPTVQPTDWAALQLEAIQQEDLEGRLIDEARYGGKFDRIFPLRRHNGSDFEKTFMNQIDTIGHVAGLTRWDQVASEIVDKMNQTQ